MVNSNERFMTNPFTLEATIEPNHLIKRDVLDRTILTFKSSTPSYRFSIILGVQGSGKSVFLTSIYKYFSNEKDWVVIELNPEKDLLQKLAAKLYEEKILKDYFISAELELPFLKIGLKHETDDHLYDIESTLEKMLECIKQHNKRILVLIDDLTDTESLKQFSAAYQIFIRQELPIFLLMAGLHDTFSSQRIALTFLNRANRIHLSPLSESLMSEEYQQVFSISEEQARKMAKTTKGYPLAFQVLGYYTWLYPNDPTKVHVSVNSETL